MQLKQQLESNQPNKLRINLPHQFNARIYQLDFMKAFFVEKFRHLYWNVHRRAGKDKTCINILTSAACDRVGTYLYLFPQLNQARRVIWKGMDGQGMRFIDHIPKRSIHRLNNSEMSVELVNGSIIQLGGSNNYDALMGSNPIGIVYSEMPLHNSMARQYLNPILVENKGWEILQGTPRGKNHAHEIFHNALEQRDQWYVKTLTVEDTFDHKGNRIITDADIEQERRNGVAEEMIRQEYYCDWNVGIQGAYYTQEMDKMEYDGRICDFEIKKSALVFTAWDIGVRDPTCIIFWQPDGHMINIINYYQATDKGPDWFKTRLDDFSQKLGIKYRYHWAPPDIMKREWGSSARSSLSLAADVGLHFLRVPDVGFDNGIQASRSIFPHIRIHKTNCRQLLDALREYRREWDEEKRVFKSDHFHNWASHPADAFRYMAIAWRENFAHPDLNLPKKYNLNRFEPRQMVG